MYSVCYFQKMCKKFMKLAQGRDVGTLAHLKAEIQRSNVSGNVRSRYKVKLKNNLNKRPTGLHGHLSIRDFTLTSCQKGSYLYIIISPIIE